MSLFDKFGKKDDDTVEIEKTDTKGWDAITAAFEKLYPDQKDPKHYGVLIPWELGGDDPLTGISIYETGEYYHFVTYGLSEIFEKETDDPEISGYGMEFTLKLRKAAIDPADEEGELRCICGIFQKIARITFEHGECFRANEYLYTGQTSGIDLHQKSALTGFIMITDTDAGSIDTPNGKVDFVEFIGCTDAELFALRNKELTVAELYGKLGSDVTDYTRSSVI
ncbi:suppressor of fused domain protein [Ruminococcus flavefaciens]|uniref:suppressor of fused domain protein n=1 Tax=Ruminococcus flavefaciens TaxID=1265 RepID=UPI001563099D|nr:suppressor of fused domain protein [Ruminococcus flavefaciens]